MSYIRSLFIAVVLAAPALLILCADEGMWTFDNVPRALIKQKYGFEITDQWLEHVRLASARVGNGGSGSFVSPDGLLFTNQLSDEQLVQVMESEDNAPDEVAHVATPESAR